MGVFGDKNKEIGKIMEENKNQFEMIRGKDNELRRVSHELEISRNSIVKLESKIR